ncbi:hypothetical protein [Streptomyces sp. NBC_00370]|uniref:hypothetical protein n=1 Tax=Streptomyces sp. NBC_00370 TaxID=2975728 RepID=UPI002E257780
MVRTARTTAFVAATLLVTGALAAPSAGAAAPDETASGTSARHCVVNSATGAESCFAAFPDAIEAATGGQVTDTPASAKAAAGDQSFRTEMKRFNAPTRSKQSKQSESTSQSESKSKSTESSTLAAADSVVQGTFFDEVQFGGSSLTITGTAPCVKDGWIEYQYDFPDDWKNRVSSVQPWADCWIWLYPEPNLTGDRDGPFDENTADVGSFMNDRAQSVGFS